MSRLIFSPDGRYLLHWFEERQSSCGNSTAVATPTYGIVHVWDIIDNKHCAAVSGYLVGVSDNSETFLTQTRSNSVKVWRLEDGASIRAKKPYRDKYPVDQRVVLRQDSRLIDIVDVFKERPTVQVELVELVTEFSLGALLWMAFWYDIGDGFDGAYGQAFDLTTGNKAWTFYKISRHDVSAPAYWFPNDNTVLLGEELGSCQIDSGESIEQCPIHDQVKDIREAVGVKSFHGAAGGPDGKTIAVSTGRATVQLWQNGKNITTLEA